MSGTSPSFSSFTDELMQIKARESLISEHRTKLAEEKKEEKQPVKLTGPGSVPAKGHSPLRFLGNMLAGGAAYGVGAGAARLAAIGLNKVLPGVSNPTVVDYLAKGTGLLAAAGTMAFADAMAQNIRMLNEPTELNKQGV
jgi:hypothetical protein